MQLPGRKGTGIIHADPHTPPYGAGKGGRCRIRNPAPVPCKDRRDFHHSERHSGGCSGKNTLPPSRSNCAGAFQTHSSHFHTAPGNPRRSRSAIRHSTYPGSLRRCIQTGRKNVVLNISCFFVSFFIFLYDPRTSLADRHAAFFCNYCGTLVL